MLDKLVILSDGSDVLFPGVTGMPEAFEAEFGLPGTEFTRRFKEWRDIFWEGLRGKHPEMWLWDEYVKGQPWNIKGYQVADAFHKNIQKTLLTGATDVYKRVKSYPSRIGGQYRVNGRPDVYVVSDHLTECVSWLPMAHPEIFEIVKKAFWSCELGAVKIDHKFFQTVFDELDTRDWGFKAIFIDDDPRNIEYAHSTFGLHGILFEGADKLEETLQRDYGFEFYEKP